MSRKNFIHQADLLFSNANGVENTATKPIIFEEPSRPTSEPNKVLTDAKRRELEIQAKLKADADAKKIAEYELAKKKNYDQDVINSKPYSPVEPLRPEPKAPELPIMPSEPTPPEAPIVSEGYPIPKPTVVINNNPDTTRIDSVGNGGIGIATSGGSGDSKKEILKKDFIPLLLTVAGLLVVIFKPLKDK